MDAEGLIAKYFSEGLSKQEEMDLEKYLSNDPLLLADFNFQKSLRDTLKSKEFTRKKEMLQEFESVRQQNKSRQIPWYRVATAASVIILLGIGFFSGLFTSDSHEKLFSENYELYPNTIYSVTRSGGEQELEQQAFTAYELEQHEKAIGFFEQLKATGKARNIDFYLGQSQLATERYDLAITSFQTVIKNSRDFEQESRWYLALTYLAKDDLEQARRTLEEIVLKNTYKNQAATRLLNRLE